MNSASSIKSKLREEGFGLRDALSDSFREQASRAIAARALALPELAGEGLVASYWPIRSEVDPRPLLDALDARGAALALPVVTHPTLVFRRWRPGDELVKGAFGVSGPGEGALQVVPAVLLMPLARFDRARNRIGYGKGHFDRTLAALEQDRRIMCIGLAFAVQEAENIPAEDHDRRLDAIVTEVEIIR